jgi:GH25 family lysozyme M1 (1,4-beta-N-acetylmuramidase)
LLAVEATFGKKIISFYFCNFYVKKRIYAKKEISFFLGGWGRGNG